MNLGKKDDSIAEKITAKNSTARPAALHLMITSNNSATCSKN